MDNMQLRALQLVFLYSYSHKKKFEMYIATVWVTIITNFLNMNDKCYTLHSSAQLTYLYYKYESFIHLFTSSYGSLYDHPYTWSSNPYTYPLIHIHYPLIHIHHHLIHIHHPLIHIHHPLIHIHHPLIHIHHPIIQIHHPLMY